MPLAERMILALEAGYAKGGDKRWGNLQSNTVVDVGCWVCLVIFDCTAR